MFQFERKLFLRSKKTLIAILILLVITLASSFIAGYHNREAKSKVILHDELMVQNIENMLQDLEEQYQNSLIDQMDYEAEQKFFTDYIANYQKEIQAVKNDDWAYFYESNIQHYQLDGQYISFAYEGYGFTSQTIENTVLVSKYLLEHEIPSAFPTELFLTAFELPKSQTDREIVNSLGQQALKGASHEIWKWQKNSGVIITSLLFLVCFTDFFIKNQIGNNRQIRLLQTSGMSRIQITCKKYIAFFILYSFLFFATYLCHFLISSLVNGNSSWIYPIPTYISKELTFSFIHTHISPIYQVIFLASCIHYLYLLFLLGVAQTIAILFKNGLAGFLVTLGMALCANLYPNIFNPFSLWNAGDLSDGSILIFHQFSGDVTTRALFILLISNLLIYILQFYLLIRKREV
ncbi:TPA: hypothetical protein ACGO63_000419 [Streptococcus suis]